MSKLKIFSSICLVISASYCYRQPLKGNWQLSYRRVEYFFGSMEMKIGPDSCYYLNQGGIPKNPPVFKWRSSKNKLNELYRQVEKFDLRNFSPVITLVPEQPFESLTLVENGKVVYEVLRQQQNNRDVNKFDSVVLLLKSFVFAENNGWKY